MAGHEIFCAGRQQDELDTGYIKVSLDYAPKTNGKKFAKWCEEHGFTPLGSERRAWSGSLSTYLRGASGIAYADGEPFLFDEEDILDLESYTTSKVNAVLQELLEKKELVVYNWRTFERSKEVVPVEAINAIKDRVEQFKCPSYFDDDGILQDCKCGRCK